MKTNFRKACNSPNSNVFKSCFGTPKGFSSLEEFQKRLAEASKKWREKK